MNCILEIILMSAALTCRADITDITNMVVPITLPIELWNQISEYDIHVYNVLVRVFRGLEQNINRRKRAFVRYVWHDYPNHSELRLNGRYYCDERPACAIYDIHMGEVKLWISADNELHRENGPAVIGGDYTEYYLHGVQISMEDESRTVIRIKNRLQLCIRIDRYLARTGKQLSDVVYDPYTLEIKEGPSCRSTDITPDMLIAFGQNGYNRRKIIDMCVHLK